MRNLREENKKMKERAAKAAMKAALIYVKHARKVVGVSMGGAGATAREVRYKIRKGIPVTAKQYQKFRRSLPGEPPRKETGLGQKSIVAVGGVSRGKFVAKVVVLDQGFYMYLLDVGIPWNNTAPRPWIEPAFKKADKEIKRALRS